MQFAYVLKTDLGRDADDMMRVFDALPDASARLAFVRTLRAVVDFRGQVVTMLDRCYLTRGMPTLLIWGERDAVIPYEHARMAHAAMPGSRLVTFESAGHFPHHSDPRRFTEVLYEFLGESAPASYRAERVARSAANRSGGVTARQRGRDDRADAAEPLEKRDVRPSALALRSTVVAGKFCRPFACPSRSLHLRPSRVATRRAAPEQCEWSVSSGPFTIELQLVS